MIREGQTLPEATFVVMEKLGPELLARMAQARPVYVRELQGVPLVAIYPTRRQDSREEESRE